MAINDDEVAAQTGQVVNVVLGVVDKHAPCIAWGADAALWRALVNRERQMQE